LNAAHEKLVDGNRVLGTVTFDAVGIDHTDGDGSREGEW
jgi:hypothetical protein